MKSVGIVTLFGLYNFGNRLQNFAVQEIFREYGFDVKTIVSSEANPKTNLKFWVKSVKNGTFVRSLKFHRFNKTYIPVYKVKSYPTIFPQSLGKEFSYFVVGSDQVWNPNIRQNQRDNFFLSFTEKQKRIAIAPSIAVTSIPEKWRECYVEGLNGFNKISVREKDSVALVHNLVDREVTVLADPTIVISVDKWKKIEKKVKETSDKYMVIMFLGAVSSERKNYIYNYADTHGLTIINLFDKKWKGIGPDEFLYLVHHASFVCTDSFHCTVFSILYNCPFAVYERLSNSKNDVNSKTSNRIESLLSMFSNDAKIQADNIPIIPIQFSPKTVENVIAGEKLKYSQYLNDQLVRNGGNK